MASAARYLDRAIALNSMYPMHYYNRGSIAFHSQDLELALMYVQLFYLEMDHNADSRLFF